MRKVIDLTGQKFNKLLVISREENAENGRTRWKCLCDCGNFTVVRSSNLKSGQVKSCGCTAHDPERHKTHGLSDTPEYNEWAGIKQRCYNNQNWHYKNYGGRGIVMCDEWKNDFLSFYNWVKSTKPKGNNSLTIERIDVNGNYCPENCTWVDAKAQANNRRSNCVYTYNGMTKNLMQWCEYLNLSYGTIHSRIYRSGWTFEDAITIPVKSHGNN